MKLLKMVVMATGLAAFSAGVSSQMLISEQKPFEKKLEEDNIEGLIKLSLIRVFGSGVSILEWSKLGENGPYSVYLDDGKNVVLTEDLSKVVIHSRRNFIVYDINEMKNVTEEDRVRQAHELIFSKYEPLYTVKPEGEPIGTLYVGKDPQCGYCNKLDRDVDDLVKAGIEVKFYPFAIFEGSQKMLEVASCSANPREQYRRFTMIAKGLKSKVNDKITELDLDPFENESRGVALDSLISEYAKEYVETVDNCEDNTIQVSNAFRKLGQAGTPAIVTSNGRLIGGYLEKEKIIGLFEK